MTEKIITISDYRTLTEFVEGCYLHSAEIMVIDELTKRHLGTCKISKLDLRMKIIFLKYADIKQKVSMRKNQKIILASTTQGIFFKATCVSKGVIGGVFQSSLPRIAVIKNRRNEKRYNIELHQIPIKICKSSKGFLGKKKKEIFKGYLLDLSQSGISIMDHSKAIRTISIDDQIQITVIANIRLEHPINMNVIINKRKLTFEGSYFQKLGLKFLSASKGKETIDVVKNIIKDRELANS